MTTRERGEGGEDTGGREWKRKRERDNGEEMREKKAEKRKRREKYIKRDREV